MKFVFENYLFGIQPHLTGANEPLWNQCWLVITVRLSGIYLRTISQWVPKLLLCMSLKIILLKSLPYQWVVISEDGWGPIFMGFLWLKPLCLWDIVIWVRLWRCACLVNWFCYQMIAKPGTVYSRYIAELDISRSHVGPPFFSTYFAYFVDVAPKSAIFFAKSR